MHFQIMDTITKKYVGDINGPYRFEDGPVAAERAKYYTSTTGHKCQPRKINEGIDWRDRERARFADGIYIHVPWVNAWWFRERYNPDHFVHLSVDQPGFVAFTADENKGVADRQTRMRGGAYLKKFFGEVLDHETITRLATELAGELEANKVKFAITADDIERVYLDGPSSCMSHSLEDYDSDVHPVRMYAAGDLAIAYLERENGHITARTVCWPSKLVYTRIYGDDVRLEPLLKNLGYKRGHLEGARLVKYHDGHDYVCPYVDDCDYVDVGQDHLILHRSSGEYSTDNTNGHIGSESEAYATCERCEDPIQHEDDAHEVHLRRNRIATWCEHCRDNAAIYCSDEHIDVHADEAVRMANGEYWSTWHFENDGDTCDRTGKYYDRDDLRTVRFRNGRDELWCLKACNEHAVGCPISGDYYGKDAVVRLPDGRIVGYDTDEGEEAIRSGTAEFADGDSWRPAAPALTTDDPNQLSMLQAAE